MEDPLETGEEWKGMNRGGVQTCLAKSASVFDTKG